MTARQAVPSPLRLRAWPTIAAVDGPSWTVLTLAHPVRDALRLRIAVR